MLRQVSSASGIEKSDCDSSPVLAVSVIIPALNEQPWIVRAVHSAIVAGAPEVIVCDGGSTDETRAVAKAAGATVISADTGRANQCNAAAAVATGDVLLFLHADCQLHSTAISTLSQRLIAEPHVVVGGFRQQIDDPRWLYRLLASGNACRARLLKWVYGDQGLFVRADVFRAMDGFPRVPLMEDLMFSRAATRRGHSILLDPPLIVSARRWQHRGVIRQTLKNWLMIVLWLCNVSPAALARHYPNVR